MSGLLHQPPFLSMMSTVGDFDASVEAPAARVGTGRPSFASRLAAALWAKIKASRDRRAIVALGPVGRRELHALLMAQGQGGIPSSLWTTEDWARDEASL